MKKAVVFDNSGTLIERYRVIKDVLNGNIFTDINSLDLIDAADSLALVVLQFNTNKLLKLDSNTLISDVIKEYDIDFDVSFSTRQVSKAEVKKILDNEKSSTVSDITDGFDILREKIKELEEKQKDGLDYIKGQITVVELVERYIAQKTGVRPSTRNGYKTVVSLQQASFSQRFLKRLKL